MLIGWIERVANEVADELMRVRPHGFKNQATRLALMRADARGHEKELGGMNRMCVVGAVEHVLRRHLVEKAAIASAKGKSRKK